MEDKTEAWKHHLELSKPGAQQWRLSEETKSQVDHNNSNEEEHTRRHNRGEVLTVSFESGP